MAGAAQAGTDLLDPSSVELPVQRVGGQPWAAAPGARVFDYAAVKTKRSLSAAAGGPPAGSTWLWFIVAELRAAKRTEGPGVAITITGDKFQAGWVPEPTRFANAAQLRARKLSMVRSVLGGTENEYGRERKGCPEGFRHDWNYADTKLGVGDHWLPAAGARWTEQKQSDRWRVELSLIADVADSAHLAEGTYLVVADQRAEKLNANQYATAMRGALFPAPDAGAREAALRQVALSLELGELRVAPPKPTKSLKDFFASATPTQQQQQQQQQQQPKASPLQTPGLPATEAGGGRAAPQRRHQEVIDLDLDEDCPTPPAKRPRRRRPATAAAASAAAVVDLTADD